MSAFRMIFGRWKTLVAVGSALAAATFYGVNRPQDNLAEGFQEPVRRYLQAEQERRVTADLALHGVGQLSREELQKLADASTAARWS